MATNTASDTKPRDPLLGKTVGGRYVIERLIGRGGVGLVYLANDTAPGGRGQVVVKVLAPHWAEDRDAVLRFDREALRMAKLDHPNVVKMYDHGHLDGRAFIVMEFIRGEPLGRYLSRRKRMPVEEFVPIAAQILLGAGYVHERGIMMRDIKPPNIMLGERGGKANHVKLLDFGLAKLIEEDEEDDVTKAHVIGTAAYMSPEQIRGDKIDVRVDVYALGVLFFLMLTGEQPIAGDNDAAVLVNHVHGVPKSLAERLPKGHRLTPELIALIESCLAKDPNDRPTNAGAMGETLREILPAALFEQPAASLKTRAAAETYWATRLNSGPAAVAALASDGNDSAEWTRPLLRRAAEMGQAPLKLAEAEVAAQLERQKAANAPVPAANSGVRPRPTPPPRPPTHASAAIGASAGTGSGAVPRPLPPRPSAGTSTGSGVRPRPTGPSPSAGSGSGALPRPTGGSGALARPKPPGPPPAPPKPAPPRTALLDSPPSTATVRVTAADAKEAVARLEEELDAARSDRRTLVPTKAPAEPPSEATKTARHTSVPPLDPAELHLGAESSDVLPIAFDDELDPPSSRRSEAIAPTVPSDPMATDALGVMAPMATTASPRAPDGGMRLGAIVAVAGLLALSLGGLTAYVVLGGGDEPASTAAPSAPAEPPPGASRPASKASAEPSEATPPEAATVGTVEVRAIAGARVEIDGEDRGEAPKTLELDVGEHRVKVVAPGHYPWQTTIDVKPGVNAAVTAEPVPMEAGAPPPEVPVAKGEPKRPGKPGSGKPKPEAKSEPETKGDGKPKPEVFLDSSKGKDDGIFLPVGGK